MEVNLKHPEERSKPTVLEIVIACTIQKLALLLPQDNIECKEKKKPASNKQNHFSFTSL